MDRTVLIVDDSSTMRRLVADALRGAGFAVLEAVNGEDALRRVRGHTVHLVITDYNMPVMGGIALIGRLRATPGFQDTPILVFTTEAADAQKQEGRAAGATGWMVKPFQPARLVRVVQSLSTRC